MLDALVAWHEGIVEMRRVPAVAKARRALIGSRTGAQQNGFADACWVLVVADHEDVMPILENARAQAHRHGSIVAAATVAIFRSLAWMYRGSLAEAEADGRQAVQLVNTVSVDIARPFTAGFLTDILREQGRLDAAAQALEQAGPAAKLPTTGHICWLLAGRGRLLLAQGHREEGTDLMLACGRQYESHGWRNPGFLDWRSDAVLGLYQTGRQADARHLAEEGLQLARQWGAPRILGRSLRVAGQVAVGDAGMPLLQEAVDVLEPSPARLEHAKALYAFGSRLRRIGRPAQARPYLSQALDLADRAGAMRFVEEVRNELRAAGARPRRSALSGPQALTPSEGRVAELAAAGHTNRHIAQTLFVTPKTVEVHLSSVYRKLKVASRREMAKVLAGAD
jgi:DNA-binding CsgD family transcriptional regulator